MALVALLFAGSALRAQSARDRGEQPFTVPLATSKVVIDGAVDEEAWNDALVVPLLYEVRPGENTPAPVETWVLLLYNETHLLVAFKAHDPEPEKIRARLRKRDRLWNDDFVGVALDTFNDERRAYELMVNPLGIQLDAINDEVGGRYDTNWNAIWDSDARITDSGYEVEFAIPFNQLRFQPTHEAQIWGFDATRSYPRKERRHMGVFPRIRGDNSYLSQTSKLMGFASVKQGRSLEIVPTLTAIRSDSADELGGSLDSSESSADLGVSVNWGMTPNWTLAGTLNPDFSTIEADSIRLGVNERFAIFYPETRPFFLAGAEIFDTRQNLVHTRTIVDPSAAIKVGGKQGRHVVSVLTAEDDFTSILIPGAEGSTSDSFEASSRSTVARYRYDLSGNSTVGGMLTDRRSDGYENTVASLDANLRLTSSDQVQAQLTTTQTEYNTSMQDSLDQPDGQLEDEAYSLSYRHTERTWSSGANLSSFGPDFRADVGFISRVDRRRGEVEGQRTWWGEPGEFFNRVSVGGEVSRSETSSGGLLDQGYEIQGSFNGSHETSGRVQVSQTDRRVEGVDFPGLVSLNLNANARPSENVGFGISGSVGDWIDFTHVQPAERTRVSPWVNLNFGRSMEFNLNYSISSLDVDAGTLFTTHVSELRSTYHFSRRAYVRAVLQYAQIDRDPELYTDPIDARTSDLFTQLLFSYEVNPRTAVFVGYNDAALANDEIDSLTRAERTLFMKLGYSWLQ